MKRILVLLLLTSNNLVFSQDHMDVALQGIVKREDTLEILLNKLRSAKTDSEKKSADIEFNSFFKETIQQEEAFFYPFDRLKTVGIVDSPDGELRIINWNIEQEDLTQKYHCYLLHKNEKKISVSELIDNSENLAPKPDGILEADNWYGALYYKIIPKEKGAKKSYVLLGWDGNNSVSTMKLIDVLYFAGSSPKLGSPVFKINKTTHKRLFFEHSKKVSMSLKYEEKYDRIIYDHLSPETPALAGFYSFYVPDLTYDAFYFDKNKWILKEDVIGVNQPTEERKEVYIKNERSGKIEKVDIKNKWENPEDSKSPISGSQHTAVTPETDVRPEEKKKEELDKKVDKKDKRDPNNLNATTGGSAGKKKRRH